MHSIKITPIGRSTLIPPSASTVIIAYLLVLFFVDQLRISQRASLSLWYLLVDCNMTTLLGLTPPDSPVQTESKFPGRLRPRWFISRGNGRCVPLIAADELPYEVQLQGAPRTMGMDRARGMEYLGESPPSNRAYSLDPQLSVDGKSDLFRTTSPSATPTTHTSTQPTLQQKRFLAPDVMARRLSNQVATSKNGSIIMPASTAGGERRTTSPVPQWRCNQAVQSDETQVSRAAPLPPRLLAMSDPCRP